MKSKRHRRYKTCFVPLCQSTTTKTPQKLFISVPMKDPIQRKWFKLCRRDYSWTPSKHTRFYCCEDHFCLEKDVENYMQHKLQGGKIFLKKDVVPSKFECQKSFVPKKNPDTRRGKRKELTTSLDEEENAIDSADEPPEEEKEVKDFDVLFQTNDSHNEDMILPDVESRVGLSPSNSLVPSFPMNWSKRPGSPEDFPSLKVIKQEVPDESSSASDFYDYSKPENCETSLTIDSEDQFDKFGKHIACQLRELPLRNALVLQEAIQSLITKERIACLTAGGGAV